MAEQFLQRLLHSLGSTERFAAKGNERVKRSKLYKTLDIYCVIIDVG